MVKKRIAGGVSFSGAPEQKPRNAAGLRNSRNNPCPKLAEAVKVAYFFKCLWTPHPPRNPPFHGHVLAKFAPRLYHSKPMGEKSCGVRLAGAQ
jgi:hypothetical protein